MMGSGDGRFGSYQRIKEPITVTPAEIIYQRRVRLLDLARETGNVAEACRNFGVSRTRYYEWKSLAERYGLEALMPKARRTPQLPNATPTHVVAELLTLAVVEPTIGCRQYADRLGDQGYAIAASTVQRHLVAHGLGKRSQRVARAAAITMMTTGLVTESSRGEDPFGFCLAAGGPGELVCVDSFYVGNLKGVGKVYQLTAIDVFTRWATVAIVLGPVNATQTIRFLDQVLKHFRRLGVGVRAVLSDNGPEYVASGFRAHLVTKNLTHVRIPPGPPTTTRCASGSTAPSSKRAGVRPSTAGTSPRSASSRPRPMPGSSATTTDGRTTGTTCGAGPRSTSSTASSRTRQHDHHDHEPECPSVTSTLGPEALVTVQSGSPSTH